MTQAPRRTAKSAQDVPAEGAPAPKRRPRKPAAAAAKKASAPKLEPALTEAQWRQVDKATEPLRVVVRVHAYPPRHNAGSEWMTHSMLRALVARGHDVAVWLSRYSPDREAYEVDGVKVVPFAASLDFGSAAKNSDVIVSHLENVPPAGALARGMGRPFVVICHNTAEVIFRNVGRGTTALAVYNSRHMQADAEAYLSEHPGALRPEKAIVVRPPVFAEEYRTTPGDKITLVNLNDAKGGGLFWKLAERLPHLQFLGVKGAYGKQIERRNDLPNVEIVEHLSGDRMRDEVYARTRVLIMPSASESWGRVGVEAMASGIPIVAAPTPGLLESLADAGIFAERGDIDAWVSTLEALSDGAQWAQASERSLARSKELDPVAELTEWCEAVESLA